MNEKNEIRGDAIESIEAEELLANAPEGERGFPEDHLPDSWADAPLSAQVARMMFPDDPQGFDDLKEYLKEQN